MRAENGNDNKRKEKIHRSNSKKYRNSGTFSRSNIFIIRRLQREGNQRVTFYVYSTSEQSGETIYHCIALRVIPNVLVYLYVETGMKDSRSRKEKICKFHERKGKSRYRRDSSVIIVKIFQSQPSIRRQWTLKNDSYISHLFITLFLSLVFTPT